jgi:hypothetical protein
LEELVERFLCLQFGKERVINMTAITENVDTKPSMSFTVQVDKDEAIVHVLKDGSHWVFSL